jgi:branched-chain amino acid transport system substrate-binding protein
MSVSHTALQSLVRVRRSVAVFTSSTITTIAVAVLLGLNPGASMAQTIKVGLVNTTSGTFATLGDQIDKAVRLYMKENAAKLPPGVKVDLIVRDDGGPIPDNGKRLAQELIVREKVNFLTGFIWTPNTAAVAPLLTESKTPLVVMNAAASILTTMSPYMVRASMTMWQNTYPLGAWAAKKYKRAYVMVTDFAPGHDAEQAFIKGFTDGGGQVVGNVRMPIKSPDFVAFMQRAKDMKPDVIFNMVTAGAPSTAIMKAYGDLGLRQAGIPFIGTGDAVTEEELVNMGDVPLGYISGWHYSMAGERPANKAFVAAWERDYGKTIPPGFIAMAAYDSMDMIYAAIREQKGQVTPEGSMKALSNYKNPNSPRGPLSIDPETRDVVQNVYIREVKKVAGRNMNVEFETIPNVKDPWKELNKKK